MKITDLLLTSGRMAYRNRKRYTTAIVLICFGTMAFIGVRTLSTAVEARISGLLDFIGGATVLVASWNDRLSPYHPGEYLQRDVEYIRRVPHVICAAPFRFTGREMRPLWGKRKTFYTALRFVDENYWDTISQYCVAGELINAQHVSGKETVCVLGQTTR